MHPVRLPNGQHRARYRRHPRRRIPPNRRGRVPPRRPAAARPDRRVRVRQDKPVGKVSRRQPGRHRGRPGMIGEGASRPHPHGKARPANRQVHRLGGSAAPLRHPRGKATNHPLRHPRGQATNHPARHPRGQATNHPARHPRGQATNRRWPLRRPPGRASLGSRRDHRAPDAQRQRPPRNHRSAEHRAGRSSSVPVWPRPPESAASSGTPPPDRNRARRRQPRGAARRPWRRSRTSRRTAGSCWRTTPSCSPASRATRFTGSRRSALIKAAWCQRSAVGKSAVRAMAACSTPTPGR